jgi:predicted metal-dependent enzyme (double-stranded beta helix superfamily)
MDLVDPLAGVLLHPAKSSESCGAPVDFSELRSVAMQLARSSARWSNASASSERRWELLIETDRLQGWGINWPVGTGIELHDHGGSAGALVVVEGTLVETAARKVRERLTVRSRVLRTADGPLAIQADRVHDVTNPGPRRAISVHVYSPPLSSMRFFGIESGELRQRRTEGP